MTDERKISLCIPTFQRVEMTFESFAQVYDDERIAEIIIVDDASEWRVYEKLRDISELLPKVKLFRNIFNRDCYFNKKVSVSYANFDWVVLLDSDNKIGKDYLDKLFEIAEWDEKMIYTPDFAKPHFKFTDYSGLIITRQNIAQYIDLPLFETLCNACNYFVSQKEYLEIWDETTNPVTSDSIYMILRWLEAGNKVQIVDGLRYEHRVHNGSHYQNHKDRTPQGFHELVLNKLRQLA